MPEGFIPRKIEILFHITEQVFLILTIKLNANAFKAIQGNNIQGKLTSNTHITYPDKMAFNFAPEDFEDNQRMVNLVQEIPDEEFDHVNKQVEVFNNNMVVEYVVKKMKYIGPEPVLKLAHNINEVWENNEQLREIMLYNFEFDVLYKFYGTVKEFNNVLSYYKKLRPEDNHPFSDNDAWEVYIFDSEEDVEIAGNYFRYKHGYQFENYDGEYFEDKYNY